MQPEAYPGSAPLERGFRRVRVKPLRILGDWKRV